MKDTIQRSHYKTVKDIRTGSYISYFVIFQKEDGLFKQSSKGSLFALAQEFIEEVNSAMKKIALKKIILNSDEYYEDLAQ